MSPARVRRSGMFAGVLAWALACGAVAQTPSTDELVAAGQRLYREGRGLSGEPVRALVQGDVPVLGTQMTCQNCHGRSGMGAIESGRIPAALAGPLLFAPEAQRQRPAYTDATLARAMREGLDSAGRPIDPLMPRFELTDGDVAALAAYLRQLGTTPSPGVGPDDVRIATVIAGEIGSDLESATLEVLETFIAARNRSGPQRLRGGHFPGQWKETYRAWSLDVWRLTGPSETWPAQLEAHYREQPVFALVGGLASEPWQPIHDFCEAVQMPCLLPNTNLPPAGNGGFYSLYYSRGLALEAELMAESLSREGLDDRVVVLTDGQPGSDSSEAAAALARALGRRGGDMRALDARHESDVDAAFGEPASAIVAWLDADGVRKLSPQLAAGSGASPIMLSSTLLGGTGEDLPTAVRERAQMARLTALPDEGDSAMQRFRAWARTRGVEVRLERDQALAYFAALTFAEGIKHTTIYISRDYMMDLLEHASTLTTYLPLYTRGGMTPGQRVLSRGGYLVDLAGRQEPTWMVP